MMKKIFIICLLLCSLFSASAVNVLAVEFEDVPKGHNHYEAVNRLVEMGVVAGYEDGTFCPDNNITRTEFCALVARSKGYDKATYKRKKLPFSDVADEYWGYDFISYCYELGVINGMDDGTFAPAAPVTMEQAIKMVVCAADLQGKDSMADGERWYEMYLRIAEKYGIDQKVQVQTGEKASRSSVAQLVYNAVKSGRLEDDKKDEESNSETDSGDEEQKIEVDLDEVAELDLNGFIRFDEDILEDLSEEDRELVKNMVWNKFFKEKDGSEIKTIVVDAGHNHSGGDTGARNEDDIAEEDITWQIADKLARMLENSGYKVVRTREKITSNIANTSASDSLKARVELAHNSLADLYISIHCNIGGGSGTETYCYSRNGDSYSLAEIIQKNITDETELKDRGVKTAGFYVIKNTRMPAVLIETGFMDNEDDMKVLTSERGQSSIARAIMDAVNEYAEGKLEID